MPAQNAKVADLLRRLAATLALEGADRFKTKAYKRAAETIESLDEDIGQLVAEGRDLTDLPGIGKAISAKIAEIVTSGTLPQLERSMARLPAELVEIAAHPALDSRQVLRVYKKLGINSLGELESALSSGLVRKQLGARIEFQIRNGLDERPRRLLWDVESLASGVERFLRDIPEVVDVSRAGSLRRKKDTVGDLNFVVVAASPAAVFKVFATYGGANPGERIGRTEAKFQLSSGITVRLSVTKPATFGLILLQKTGSETHLADLEARAARRNVSLSARGLGPSAGAEYSVYRALGMRFVDPELREGRGEVQAAAKKSLPALVTVTDLRGDLHMHTTASDGASSLEQMAEAAQQHGYEYIAITDHSQSLKITNGLTEKRLLQQIKAIDKLNRKLRGIVVLKSAEVDILEDGRLDYSDAVLKELDFTICSIHSKFALSPQQQTERLMRAMDNRYFSILGHATGRLLLKREGYGLDMPRIVNHARKCGCYFEINSSPDRLDLSDENAKLAKDGGVLIAVNTDAHSVRELDFITAGVNQARRAWLEPQDVLNTLPLKTLLKRFRR